jgi:hypothetical protein
MPCTTKDPCLQDNAVGSNAVRASRKSSEPLFGNVTAKAGLAFCPSIEDFQGLVLEPPDRDDLLVSQARDQDPLSSVQDFDQEML